MNVWVIGTDPPCPRCGLLVRMVEEIAEGSTSIRMEHFAFDTPRAEVFAARHGRKIGTAKEVARAAGIPVNWRAVYGEIERAKTAAGPGADPADTWTPELDDLLRPCELAAENTGYLMTPVLVIDGEVIHQGSVPSKEHLCEFLGQGNP